MVTVIATRIIWIELIENYLTLFERKDQGFTEPGLLFASFVYVTQHSFSYKLQGSFLQKHNESWLESNLSQCFLYSFADCFVVVVQRNKLNPWICKRRMCIRRLGKLGMEQITPVNRCGCIQRHDVAHHHPGMNCMQGEEPVLHPELIGYRIRFTLIMRYRVTLTIAEHRHACCYCDHLGYTFGLKST